MALAIDVSSPAVASGAGPTVATGSFTPPANSTLVIAASMDGGATPPTPSITDNLGGHLTYTLSDWMSGNVAPNAGGQSAVWTAPVVTSAPMTVSVTNGDAAAPTTAVKVWVITGAKTPPVGAHGKAGTKSAATIAQSYTAQATSGWGFIVNADFDQTGAETAGTGTTVDSSTNVGTAITATFARRTIADDVNGNSNTLNLTIPATSTNMNWVYVELAPAVSGNFAVWPGPLPGPIGSPMQFRPWVGTDLPPAPPAVVAALVPAQIGPARHQIALATPPRRGRMWLVPQQPIAFIAAQIGARHPVVARPPRGRFLPVPVPVAVVVTAPTFVPPQVGVRRPSQPPGRLPRGRFTPLPSAPATTVPGRINGRTSRPFIFRRGQIFSVPVPAVVVTQTGPLVPRITRLAIHWPGSVRRGRIFSAPSSLVATPPRTIRAAIRWPGPVRRGRIFSPPAPIGAPPPRPIRLAIHWPGAVRRGSILPVFAPVVVVATGPVIPKTTRLAIHWPGTTRRGQIFPVPVTPAVVAPTGPVIPKTVRLAIHWPGPTRRGKIFFIPSSSQAAPTVTPVPPRMIQQHQQTRVLARRGKITPVFRGQPGWVPPPTRPSSPLSARGARPGMTPRGRRWVTPTTPTGPIPRPPIGSPRRILAVRPPRGRFLPMPYPPAVVVPPPAYVPRIMRQRARFWYFARRGARQFTRLTGATAFPAEFLSLSSALDMIGAGSAVELVTNATTGSAEFASGDRGVTFVDGDTGTQFGSGP